MKGLALSSGILKTMVKLKEKKIYVFIKSSGAFIFKKTQCRSAPEADAGTAHPPSVSGAGGRASNTYLAFGF